MTCIVGLVDKGRVYIGGDSAGSSSNWQITVRSDPKVFRNGDFLMGFTSSFRMGQLLAHSLKPPRRNPDDDVFSFMVTGFIDAVRSCLKEGGFAEKNNEAERGGTFIVGYSGRLFQIHGDYQVSESSVNFDACGCGAEVALGAMAATEGQKPEARIKIALAAAEQFSAGVRGPFHVESIG